MLEIRIYIKNDRMKNNKKRSSDSSNENSSTKKDMYNCEHYRHNESNSESVRERTTWTGKVTSTKRPKDQT